MYLLRMKKDILFSVFILFSLGTLAQSSGKKEDFVVADTISLDNVIVTGYQKIDKRYTTSSVTTIKMEDLKLPGFTSIDQMMEGKIPDLVLTT